MKVEHAVGALVPKRDWTIVSHQVIFHGRRVCHARKPACGCTLAADCPAYGTGPDPAQPTGAGQGPEPGTPAAAGGRAGRTAPDDAAPDGIELALYDPRRSTPVRDPAEAAADVP